MLDKWKALCYIYIILIDGYAKDGLLALKATTEIKRVLREEPYPRKLGELARTNSLRDDGMHKNLFGEGGPCGSAERY